MTPQQIALVHESFDAMWPVRQSVCQAFYDRFFELAPEARQLFPDDLEAQRTKFMDSLAAMVGALDKNKVLQSIIDRSGRDHSRYGAQRTHFAAFRTALEDGLKAQFGSSFTPEMRDAWLSLYDHIQSQMQRAGNI